MSVYTSVDRDQLDHFLRRYDIGAARSLQAIAAGITNTNYRLDTERGEYVLTLYEHHSDDELVYMLGLQQHLAARGVRCARPVADRRGECFSTLRQRPAAIAERVAGEVCAQPGLEHCAQIGAELARFHLAGADFTGDRPNPRGPDWILAARDMLIDALDQRDRDDIDATLASLDEGSLNNLPRGAIHADLFHDNALFTADGLGGILDFDYACSDCFAFDLAVLLNDWCVDAKHRLDAARVDSVLDAYQQQRRLDAAEVDALPTLLRLAALRFWLSRLYDREYPLSGELTFIKPPETFRAMHRLRADQMRLPG